MEWNEKEDHAYFCIYHFCRYAFPACFTLWRNVGRTMDKDVNRKRLPMSFGRYSRMIMLSIFS